MSDEERQRQMDFILDTLARLTANTDRIAEMQARQDERWARENEHRIRDRDRLARLEASFVVLTELAQRHEDRLDQGDARAANLEAAVTELRRLTGQGGPQS